MSDKVIHPVPAAIAIPGYQPGTWQADPVRSEIGFSVRTLMAGTVRGRFTGHDVTIVTGETPLSSAVSARIDVASIDTGNGKRDGHLRSADFLAAQTYPTMTYRSAAIRQAGHGWVVDGELTLHGVTRPVPLALEATGFGPGAGGGHRATFTATARINRGDFGIGRYHAGGAGIGSKVSISIRIDADLQP